MNIEALKDEKVKEFVDFCRAHRMDVDDSFLYEDDLRNFNPDDENPTYIITDENGKITGAASLMLNEYNRRGKKARFRIFYSEINELEHYKMLLEKILNHRDGFDNIFVFINVENKKMMEFMEDMNFNIYRYSFLLVREENSVPEYNLPEDYYIRPLIKGQDEETWCIVRNAGFANLKGSETPITPDMVTEMLSSDENIEEGSMILFHRDRPVGVVRGTKDEYEGAPIMNIGPLAIIPEYQGRGLGRCLLRAVLQFGKSNNYNRAILCVNAENERAKALYLKEGFKQVEAVVCYKYDFKCI